MASAHCSCGIRLLINSGSYVSFRTGSNLLRLAFFRRQNWTMVLVASSSQSGSASKVINSMELKNFTALGLGLPSARSFPALTRIATSSVEQFNSFATCSARRRAGISFAAQVANAVCLMSSFMLHLADALARSLPHIPEARTGCAAAKPGPPPSAACPRRPSPASRAFSVQSFSSGHNLSSSEPPHPPRSARLGVVAPR